MHVFLTQLNSTVFLIILVDNSIKTQQCCDQAHSTWNRETETATY